MKAICLHDKRSIAAFLRHNPALHVYALGDLDEFFWPSTTWYGLQDGDNLRQIALVYAAPVLPVLLAISAQPNPDMALLLQSISYLLPSRIYAHLSDDAAAALADHYDLQSNGTYYKMALHDYSALHLVDTGDVVPLSTADLAPIQALYQASYPNNSFDPRMLETGCFYGIWHDAMLVSIAGIHVYSPSYRVAALGNITTHPGYRGRGLARATTARLCQMLRGQIDHIGLNVHVANQQAISCYQQLGFAAIATYGEYTLTASAQAAPTSGA